MAATVTVIRCDDVIELLSDYIEAALVPRQARAVVGHLHDCPGCRNCLDNLLWTIRMLRELPPESPPDDVHEQALSAFRAWANSY